MKRIAGVALLVMAILPLGARQTITDLTLSAIGLDGSDDDLS